MARGNWSPSLRVYVGWDRCDETAFAVTVRSLERHASIPIEVIPIWDDLLRTRGLYWRREALIEGQRYDIADGKPFSTSFSFARFGAVPMELADHGGEDWVLFTDPDVLWRADVAELLALADDRYAVMCVKHDHRPDEKTKMRGQVQTLYDRKNWSSVMLIKPGRCRGLTVEALNTWRGSELHALRWVEDSEIGGLPIEWNWLEGWSDESADPKLVHMTRGTPDMPGYEGIPFACEWRRYLT